MDEKFFSKIKVEEVEISPGFRIGLPVRYYDWSWINAYFPAPAAKVQGLLPSRKLKPILIMPGIAIIALTAMEYRKIADVPPYNEFSISIPVQYEPTLNIPGLPVLFDPLISPERYRKLGMWIHHLPVTTQKANDFGVKVWGYPKLIAEITFEDVGEIRRCRLRAEGKEVITLEVKKLTTKPQHIDVYTYSMKDNQLLRTLVQTQGLYGTTRLPGGASYVLGDHPIADELKTLGMSKVAVGRFYATQVQSLLHAASERLAH